MCPTAYIDTLHCPISMPTPSKECRVAKMGLYPLPGRLVLL